MIMKVGSLWAVLVLLVALTAIQCWEAPRIYMESHREGKEKQTSEEVRGRINANMNAALKKCKELAPSTPLINFVKSRDLRNHYRGGGKDIGSVKSEEVQVHQPVRLWHEGEEVNGYHVTVLIVSKTQAKKWAQRVHATAVGIAKAIRNHRKKPLKNRRVWQIWGEVKEEGSVDVKLGIIITQTRPGGIRVGVKKKEVLLLYLERLWDDKDDGMNEAMKMAMQNALRELLASPGKKSVVTNATTVYIEYEDEAWRFDASIEYKEEALIVGPLKDMVEEKVNIMIDTLYKQIEDDKFFMNAHYEMYYYAMDEEGESLDEFYDNQNKIIALHLKTSMTDP